VNATCTAHLIIPDFIASLLFGERYKVMDFLIAYNLLHPHPLQVTVTLILLSTYDFLQISSAFVLPLE
jgi:hypothetical protein